MSNLIAKFVNEEGEPVGPELDLPQSIAKDQLSALLNSILQNEAPLPYVFFINDDELEGTLGEHLDKRNMSVETVLQVVYKPMALFTVRPVTRCSATMPGHTDAVLSVCFSPCGRRLASGSGDTTVRFWDLGTQLPKTTSKGHTNWVLCVAWAPDSRLLASGGMDGNVRLWDIDGKPVGLCKGHKQWVTALAWEPIHKAFPCRRVASSSKDGSVRVWDCVTKKSLLVLHAHTQAVSCLRWAGDDKIYSGSRDCQILVWDANTGQIIMTLKEHAHWINTLALSTDYVLRTGAFDEKGRGVTKDTTEEEAKALALARYNKAKAGKPERLVSASDDFTLILWEANKSKSKIRMTGHKQLVNHVVFSPDGRFIASASFDKSVKLWDGNTGKFLCNLYGHVGPVYQVAWSSDSRLLVSGSKDSTLKVWDAYSHKLKEDLPGHADEVFSVDWSPDGQKVASGGKDKVLKLWRH